MTAAQRGKLMQRAVQRLARARELLAYADTMGITIGWEGTKTTFHPASDCTQEFIQEVTILSAEVKHLRERRDS